MQGGPWLLFDHYLVVRPWSPEFIVTGAKVEKTIVWVRFPGLGIMFYDESVLLTIASTIGTPIKVDLNTLNMARGRFARVCVEIELDKPVVGKFNLNGVWYNIEYEGLHLLCTCCGCYGHVLRNCSSLVQPLQHLENGTTEIAAAEKSEQPAPGLGQGVVLSSGDRDIQGETVSLKPHGDWLVVQRKNKKQNSRRFAWKDNFPTYNKSVNLGGLNHEKIVLSHRNNMVVPKIVVASHAQVISFCVREGSREWVCSAVYASPRVKLRDQAWEHLSTLRESVTVPWLVLGDFNEIATPSECRDGIFSLECASKLLNMMEDCSLLEWVRFGDRNTKFFHAQTLSRRRRNKVRGLFFPNGMWHTEPEALKVEAVRFFTHLFSEESGSSFTDMVGGSPRQVTAPVSRDEVRKAIMSMGSFKSLGPDGFPPFFYKNYWPIVGEELWKTVRDAFQVGFSDPALLETQIVLIPKVEAPTALK
uniref:Transposon TX1 uncharacterized n=1 Tax=Cajanus cajan TaxID=3821 RepID=A0A151TJI6_CAJCA|nr:Transposon TX1 uncharacterized [Cajanus cajan]